ncbi:MAG: sulfotransferase [Planctomycetes bacterium]|nr:sulfotransferase [Planctomycetota bacterium]
MLTLPIRSLQNYQVEETRFFVLVGSQRSGTNFCREVLNTSFQTFVHGEILLPYPTPSTWHNFVRTMVSRALPPVLPQDAAELVDDYLIFIRDDTRRAVPSKATNLKALGFDIKYNQLSFIKPVLWDLRDGPFLIDYLRARNIPILHMIRRNMLHQVLSIQIAAKRNTYHSYTGGGGGARTKVTLAADELLGGLEWIDNEVTHFRRLTAGMQVLDVAYEDLVSACDKADPSGWLDPFNELLDGVRKTLGIENAFFRPTTLKKVIDRPYREIVANHAEIVAAVAQSKFARFAETM